MLAFQKDVDQATMLKAFLKELRAACGTRLQAERQLAAVNLQLTDEERDELRMLSYKE